MSRLWVKVIKRHRIAAQEAAPCAWEDHKGVLVELCKRFDAPAPIWLSKHEREFDEFRRTAFSKDHFIEDVPFDSLEVEFLADDGVRRKSDDPRNQF